jgi:phosphatidylglycerol:prolipoprotein diacylglycerol transferase
VLFYQYPNWSDYLRQPLDILAFWHGGMSFHGGLIGSVIAGWWGRTILNHTSSACT